MAPSEITTELDPRAVDSASVRLREAQRRGAPCPPVRDLIGSNDLVAAYAVQRRLAAERRVAGATIVGRKIGLTSFAVQEQLGVDQPDFGVLFDDMEYADGDIVSADAVMQPRIEAEIAFVLRYDLVDGPLDESQVREAIDYALVAVEICGSRIDGWDITIGDTVADNASAGAFVLGSQRKTLSEFEPREVTMSMAIDGETVSTGSGTACLGDPINAVAWLARTVREFGEPLRAGQIVLSGALGPMREVRAGSTVRAEIDLIGAVEFTIGEQR